MHENNWTFKQLMARLISCWCVFFFLLQILFVSQLHYRDMAATASSGWDHTEPGKAWIAVTYSIIHIIWLNSNNSFGPLHFSLLPSTSFQAVLLVNSPKLLLISLSYSVPQPQSADCYQYQYDSGSEVNWGSRGNLIWPKNTLLEPSN